MSPKDRIYWAEKFNSWCRKQKRGYTFFNFTEWYEKVVCPTLPSHERHTITDDFLKTLTKLCLTDNADYPADTLIFPEMLLRWLEKIGYVKVEDNKYTPTFELEEKK